MRKAPAVWLRRLRLDIHLPELSLALENQRKQHYHPITIFGGEDIHEKTTKRDILKRKLCLENNISIIDVRFDAPITK